MRILLLLISIFTYALIQAQSYDISGVLVNNEGFHIESCHCFLYSRNENLSVKNEVSDKDGYFKFTGISKGVYILEIQHVSYNTKKITVKVNQGRVGLGNILLTTQENKIEEIVISHSEIESFVDKKIFRLNSNDRENSKNSLDVIDIIPQFYVDENKINSSRGGNVKVLINGINATESDLLAIPSDLILRVEYYETPPVRYASMGIGALVNVITKEQHNTGGILAVNLQNAINAGFGNDLVSFKYNLKNTQIGFKYYLTYRDYTKRVIDESLQYTFDGVIYEKKKEGIDSPFKYTDNLFDFDFNHYKKGNYVFSGKLSLTKFDYFEEPTQKILQLSPNIKNKISYRTVDEKHVRPVVDLYFSKEINHKQRLFSNIVFTSFDTDFNNILSEKSLDGENLFESNIEIDGNKHSIISDLVYEIQVEKSEIEIGARYTGAYSNQTVLVENKESLTSRTDEVYSYASLGTKYNKFSYYISLGLNSSYFNSEELNKDYSFLYIRPQLKLQYKATKKSEFGLSYQLNTINPTLSQLSNNPVLLDPLLAYSGNPNLKPYNSHSAFLSYSYQAERVYLATDIICKYASDPIQPYFETDSEYILQTFTNMKYYKEYRWSVFGQWFPFSSKWLRLRFSGTLFRNIVKHENKSWSHNDIRIIPTLICNYNKLNLKTFYATEQTILNGELLETHPSSAYIELNYKANKTLSVLVGIRYPFYDSWCKSSLTHNTSIVNRDIKEKVIDNANMIYFNVSYILPFGKQIKDSKKKFNNKDSDSGILK